MYRASKASFIMGEQLAKNFHGFLRFGRAKSREDREKGRHRVGASSRRRDLLKHKKKGNMMKTLDSQKYKKLG